MDLPRTQDSDDSQIKQTQSMYLKELYKNWRQQTMVRDEIELENNG